MNEQLKLFIDRQLPAIEDHLHDLIKSTPMPDSLQKAMLYSIDAGGKRIRPLLVLAALDDLNVHTEDALTVACAAEFIHTYSLIHDDLPAMDDDDFRRGKPTNHKVFGEAVAVLAGDALQTSAFESLTKLKNTNPAHIVELIRLLGKSAGASGMVGGQVLDMEGEMKQSTLSELEMIHLNKTGALLSFCIESAGILAESDEKTTKHLRDYAYHIGLAFQIKDDILDITSTTEELGKPAGSDEASDKSTYPSLLGMDGAEEKLQNHWKASQEAISFIEKEPSMLRLFADYIVKRKS